MPIIYDKPFKTYAEQIKIIKRKNVIVSDYNFAKEILSTVSYHTLMNGYKDTLLKQTNTEIFIDGITIENLYTLHLLDTNLNSLLFKNILYFERSYKTKLSYLIASRFGVFSDFTSTYITKNKNDYLSLKNYQNNSYNALSILKELKKSIIDCKKHNHIAFHYRENKNHIPPWILVTNLTFGQVILWYNILKKNDKTDICEQILPYSNCDIEQKKELLKSSFDLLRCYRNNMAHGNRTFNKNIQDEIAKPGFLNILSNKVLNDSEYNNNIGRKDLFSIILVINILIQDRFIINNFYNDLLQIFKRYDGFTIGNQTIYELFDLPINIFKRLEDLQIHKNTIIT